MSSTETTNPIDELVYTYADLVELSGETDRRVQFYKEIGLLPKASSRGRNGGYPRWALARLCWIRDLRDAEVPLQAVEKLIPLWDARVRGIGTIDEARNALPEKYRFYVHSALTHIATQGIDMSSGTSATVGD